MRDISQHGIRFEGASGVGFYDVQITGNTVTADDTSRYTDNGVSITAGSGETLKRFTISGNKWHGRTGRGIYAGGAGVYEDIHVHHNYASGGDTGSDSFIYFLTLTGTAPVRFIVENNINTGTGGFWRGQTEDYQRHVIARNNRDNEAVDAKLLVDVSTTPDTMTASDVEGKHFTNYSASPAAIQVFTLPAATVGAEVTFSRNDATYALRADPNGSEIFFGEAAGKYAEIATDGGFIELKCRTTGVWNIEKSAGTINIEA